MSRHDMHSGITESTHPIVISKSFSELDATELLAALELRSAVFVVEQECVYNDLDGRDAELGTVHSWIEVDARPAAYLRQLDDGGGIARIGRVVTHADHRGQGLAAHLLRVVSERHLGPMVLDAQSHLVAWYEALGFTSAGSEYIEDGIPHVPMMRS